MKGKKKGLIALSALFTLSFGAALAGCGGGAHNPTLVAGKDPTCTEAGYEQYYLCTHCDKMYSDEAGKHEIAAPVVKDALGHDMSKHDGNQATCTKPGNVEYYTCSREAGVYYANEAGTQTLEEIGVTVEHDFTGEKDGVPNTRPAEDPTKDAFGRKPSWTCNMCGTMFGDEYGDKVVTEEDLKIDKIQETIDGTATGDFYHSENAFVIGAANVRDGGLGMVLNATLASDGVYFHLVTNHNTPAAEQSKWGNVKIYINARNTEDKHLPGNAAVSEAQTICMNLGLNGNIGTHDAHTVKAFQTETNGDDALTKFTTTWEIYCSFEKLAETNKAVLAYAFEKQDGKTVLKNGYNILVTTVGCIVNKNEADKFDNNGTSVCRDIGDGDVEKAWYLWEKSGYSDSGAEHKYMIVTHEGFSEDFQNVATQYKVTAATDENATISGLSEKVAANGSLEGTVTVKEGYVFRGLNINGKTVQANAGAFSVSLADLNLPWNTAEITVTPVVIKNETQSVTLTLKDKAKEGLTPLANTKVSLTDGFGDPITGTTDEKGVVTFNDLLCMTYTLTVEGYPQKTVVVTKGTGTAESELIKIFAIASNDNVIVSDLEKTVSIVEALNPDKTYTGTAEVVTDSTLKNANVLFETTVKAENFEDGWTGKSNMQRFMIQMTESGKGLFFWVWTAGENKANVKAINDLNNRENEGGSELDINDWTEEERGWIVPFIRSDDGLKLRVLRDGGTISLYAYDGVEWVYFGKTECEEDDQTKIVLYGTGCGWEFSQNALTDLGTFVEEKLPVVGTPGHIAHYVNGNKYYLPDGTPTTAEEVKTELIVSQATVTLVLKGLDGNNITVANGTKVTVKSQFHNGELTADSNGVLSGTLYAGEYTASLYGYKDATLTVSESGEVTLTMNATIAYTDNGNVFVDDANNTVSMDKPSAVVSQTWRGNAEIVTDGDLAKANVLFETTLKMSDTSNWIDGDYDATIAAQNQRLAIQLTKSGKGFAFWLFNHNNDMTAFGALNDKSLQDCWEMDGITNGEADDIKFGWVYAAALGADGVNLRFIRYGATLTVYAKHGNSWEKLGETTCDENDELQVKVFFAHAGFEVSELTFTDLGTYVKEQLPVVGTPGHIAHYVNGNKYYLPDGTPTTAEAIKTEVEVSEAVITLVLKGLDGNNVAVTAGTEVTIKSQYHNSKLTAGANGILSGTLFVGTYTASLYGYKDATLTVEENGAVMLTMNATIAYESNDNVVVNNTEKTITIVEGLPADKSYTGNAEYVTDAALKSANILFETTVKANNFEDGWTGKSTMQRFMIQMTESGKGLFFWVWTAGENKANVKAINDLNNRENEGGKELDINDWTEEERGWIVPLIRGENGLKLRVVRYGDTIALYAHNGAEWVYFGSVECEEDDQTKIVLYGTGCGWEFSEMNVTDLGTYVKEQLPVVGTPGHIAHFEKGGQIYLLDGTPATAEDIVTEVVASEATVTLVLKDLEGNNLTVAGTEITIDSRYHKGVLTADANGVLSGTLCAGVEYTVSLYGYNDATFTVEASGTATLTMNATLGYASNDNVIVNDKNQTITIVEAIPDDKSYAGSAEVVVDGSLKNADVVLETTVRAINFEDGWTYKTTMQRFMIQMTESGKGIFFWTFNSEGNKANIQEISSFTNREENKGKDLNGLTEKERGWIVPLIKSADGLKLRIVRNGDTIALFAYNGTDWVGIGNMKCEANDNLKVVLYGTGCGWEFSQISVKASEKSAEHTLNAAVTGTKAGVTTKLDEGATVRFTNLLGYDKTFTVSADGTIGSESEKLSAGEYTVTVSGNSYAVFQKKILISADVTTLAFDYEKFTIVANSGSYDRYDFSHVEGDNPTIAVNDAVERFNVLSTDTYDNVSVTLGGKFDNSTYSSKSQGIFIKFEDGKYMFLRFDFFNGSYKIAWMGGDTWDLPRVQDWGWDDIHLMDEAQTQKWTSGQEMKLQLVREGKTLKVYLDGVLYRTNELNEEYADDKVQVGFFAWDAAEDASWNFEISEELPEA